MQKENNLKGADWILNLEKFGQKPGLSRVTYMLDKVGNPHEKINFIHVAGTNGKGSTSAYLAEILKQGGYRVGLFTSPFMETFNERFKINDEMISEKELNEIVEEVKIFTSDENLIDVHGHPTQFEIVTVIAMLYFYRKNVDIVVLEVGLGGRWDATNVIKTPLVSIITNIALEHTDVLGDTVEEIAAEKAGIIKENVPLITAVEDEKAIEVIEEIAEEMNALLFKLNKDFKFNFKDSHLKGQEFDYRGISGKKFESLNISLLGYHQLKNASLAVAIVEKLNDLGYSINEETVRSGLKVTVWPGRMEILTEDPLILLDASHNLEGIRCLSREIRKHFFEKKDIIFLMGILADKEVDKMLAEVLPLADKVVFTTPLNPRAKDPQALVEQAVEYLDKESVYVEKEVERAVDLALEQLETSEKALICCGSFFLVSPVRNYILNSNIYFL